MDMGILTSDLPSGTVSGILFFLLAGFFIRRTYILALEHKVSRGKAFPSIFANI